MASSKRIALSLQQKQEILRKVENGAKPKDICKNYSNLQQISSYFEQTHGSDDIFRSLSYLEKEISKGNCMLKQTIIFYYFN